MPFLDVSDVLLDADFAESLTVNRIAQTVDPTTGLAVQTTTTLTIVAVVTQGSMNPVIRAEDYELSRKTITVHSQSKLQAAVVGSQPDVVVWNGSNYITKMVSNWSHFGAGFYAAECELQDTQEAA